MFGLHLPFSILAVLPLFLVSPGTLIRVLHSLKLIERNRVLNRDWPELRKGSSGLLTSRKRSVLGPRGLVLGEVVLNTLLQPGVTGAEASEQIRAQERGVTPHTPHDTRSAHTAAKGSGLRRSQATTAWAPRVKEPPLRWGQGSPRCSGRLKPQGPRPCPSGEPRPRLTCLAPRRP